MSVRPPVLLLFISRRVFYFIWYFVVRSTVYYCLPCVLPLLVLASVRLLQVFGRVFGCLGSLAVCSAIRSVWPCVRLLEVFGRVFGCYKFLAVCSAVSSVWPCVRPFSSVWPCVRLLRVFGRVFGCYNFWPCVQLLQALAVRSAVSSIGRFRFCHFLHVFICTLFYLFRALPIHLFSLAPSFFLVVPSILFRHVLSRTRIFSRSFYSSIFYYCSALFMYSLFLHILCVLILLCFGRDFCFLLFRSYSRGLFLPQRVCSVLL